MECRLDTLRVRAAIADSNDMYAAQALALGNFQTTPLAVNTITFLNQYPKPRQYHRIDVIHG